MAIPGNTDLDDHRRAARARAQVRVIRPDVAAASAIGPDLLDPAVRGSAARADRDQGLRAASAAAAFWR